VSNDSNDPVETQAALRSDEQSAAPAAPEHAGGAPPEEDAATSPEISASDAASESQAAEADSSVEETGNDVPWEYLDQGHAEPLELIEEPSDDELEKQWYILKVQVNREDSIRESLMRRVRIAGLERFFGDIIIPTEDVAEFTKTGKRRIVKRKLYPGYIVAHIALSDDTWFLVRETSGIGDFTGSGGKPSPMPTAEIEKILRTVKPDLEGAGQVRTSIPFKHGDRVRVKEGYFQNFEGDVEAIDETHGRITVMINIFGRPTPVELEHWQVEAI
jgi:transcriptional antiterminator NusG